MWLTRDALVLSSLSGQPRFASVHSSGARAGGKGVRLSTQHTLNTAATLCSAQALHLDSSQKEWNTVWQVMAAGAFSDVVFSHGNWPYCSSASRAPCHPLGTAQPHVHCFITSQNCYDYFTAVGQNCKCTDTGNPAPLTSHLLPRWHWRRLLWSQIMVHNMPMRKFTPLPLLLCSSQAKNKLLVEFSLFSSHGREYWSLKNEDLEWFLQAASIIMYIADVFSSLRL